jgi:hypothetical protein
MQQGLTDRWLRDAQWHIIHAYPGQGLIQYYIIRLYIQKQGRNRRTGTTIFD